MKSIKLIVMASLALFIGACQNRTTQSGDEAKETISPNGLDTENASTSYLIPVDSANKMIGSYLSSITSASNEDTPELQSLIMDANALRNYLSDTSIKNVKVMFAHTLDYINSGHQGQQAGYKSGALTFVFAGYNAQGNYVFAPNNMVLDHAVPCPNHCVISGSASNSFLQ